MGFQLLLKTHHYITKVTAVKFNVMLIFLSIKKLHEFI
ncbi:hypothetical protein CLOSBL3_12315 [Clostridiaceae bacterium BL-3]|nr:hypothetical protein CLOSBL3_12315 [Clostridiaceae bacterium BL-3]